MSNMVSRLRNAASLTFTLLAAVAVVTLAASVTSTRAAKPASVLDTGTPAMYYVSPNGSGTDGLSWSTAWTSPNKINWSVIQPGDTINIDGGANGITYTSSQIAPTVDGTAGSPITIRVSPDAGHNGLVTLFGGRNTLLPYCGQASYTYQTSGVQSVGIDMTSRSYVVVDGGQWHGLHIYGYNKYGVELARSSNIVIRNVEVNDNGTATNGGSSGWYPDNPGIHLSGTSNVVERADVHDNGQDSLQSSGDFANFTLGWSYLHSTRTDPDGNLWNACRHVDGIQVWSGTPSGLTVHDTVVANGMQGLLLGDTNSWVNNVTVTNTLFFGTSNASLHTNDTVHPFTGWRLDHVTSVRDIGANWVNVRFKSSTNDIQVTNSIFFGGTMLDVPSGAVYTNNCEFQIPQGATVGQVVDPRFTNISLGDYALQAGSPCVGKGATSITSVNAFLAIVQAASEMPTATPAPPTQTPIPPSATPTATAAPQQPDPFYTGVRAACDLMHTQCTLWNQLLTQGDLKGMTLGPTATLAATDAFYSGLQTACTLMQGPNCSSLVALAKRANWAYQYGVN